jgi:hypothetical protein
VTKAAQKAERIDHDSSVSSPSPEPQQLRCNTDGIRTYFECFPTFPPQGGIFFVGVTPYLDDNLSD